MVSSGLVLINRFPYGFQPSLGDQCPTGLCTGLDCGGQIRGFHRWILSPLGAVVFRPLRAAFYGRVCDPGTHRPEPAGSALPSTLLLPTLLLCQKLLCISYTSEEARPQHKRARRRLRVSPGPKRQHPPRGFSSHRGYGPVQLRRKNDRSGLCFPSQSKTYDSVITCRLQVTIHGASTTNTEEVLSKLYCSDTHDPTWL